MMTVDEIVYIYPDSQSIDIKVMKDVFVLSVCLTASVHAKSSAFIGKNKLTRSQTVMIDGYNHPNEISILIKIV